jgi:hypothetical protein
MSIGRVYLRGTTWTYRFNAPTGHRQGGRYSPPRADFARGGKRGMPCTQRGLRFSPVRMWTRAN